MTKLGPIEGTTPHEEKSVVDLGVNFDRVWNGIASGMWATEPGPLERLASRLLRSPALARALVATPSLFVAWLLASIVIFAIGAYMTQSTNQPIVPLLAPAIAGIGVAFAYGTAADPAWELTRSMAVPERLLLLIRVVAVFVTNSVIGLVATLLTDRTADVTFLWLLPMTTVALVGLAVAIVSNSPTIGSIAALGVWFAFLSRTFVETRALAEAITADRIAAATPVYTFLAAASVIAIWISLTDNWKAGFFK